jgi:hypothetical protein
MIPRRFCVATLWLIAMFCSGPRAHGQAPVPAQPQRPSVVQTVPFALRGEVRDWKDSPVAGALVRLEREGSVYQVTTGKGGLFILPEVAPGEYRVIIAADGFPPLEREMDLREPPAGPVILRLQVMASEKIEVRPIDAGNSNLAVINLSGRALDSLGAGDLFQRLRELAGATGRPGDISIFVDGFPAGVRLPPREAIELVRINANGFAPEFADVTAGRIEVTTKPGVDDFHGQLQFTFSDAALDARDAFAPSKPPSQIRNYTGYASAPLIRNKWGFLAYAGRWEQDLSQVINATVLDASLTGTATYNVNAPAPARSTNLFVQSSYLAAASHSIAVSYSRTEEHASGQGLEAGRALPEFAFDRRQTEHTARAAAISTPGSRTLNELRAEWLVREGRVQALTEGPAIMVLDAFTGGGNQGSFFREESTRTLRITDHLTRAHRNHTLKFGVETTYTDLANVDRSGWGGTFVFGTDVERDGSGAPATDAAGGTTAVSPIEVYRRTVLGMPGYGPSQFSIITGNPAVGVSQWEVAAFGQDDWRPTQAVTLSYGMRGEMQTNVGVRLDLAPRIGIVWMLDENRRSVVRGAAGVFFTRLAPSLTLESIRLDGTRQKEIVIPRPGFFAQLPATFDGLPATISSIRAKAADLRAARTFAGSFSYERQLPGKLFGSLEYRWRAADHLVRSQRIAGLTANTPVFQFESTGRSRHHELVAGLRAILRGQPIYISYTLGYQRDDTDGAFSLPAVSGNPDGEFGWAASDQRHNLSIAGSLTMPFGVSLSGSITAGSGRPFNVTTGRDNNGDTIFTDRPALAAAGDAGAIATPFGWLNPAPSPGAPTIPRNFARGAGEISASLYAFRMIKLRGPSADAPEGRKAGRTYSLTLSASAENLFNRTNLTSYNGVLTSQAFARPIRALGPRRLQLAAGIGF